MTATLLDLVLQPGGLSTVFQPIFEVGGDEGPRLHALECLTRGPASTNLESPRILMEYARRKRAEGAVDRACVASALRTAGTLSWGPRLCLNVHAATLGRDPEFCSFLGDTAEAWGISLDRIVVEVVESLSDWDRRGFVNALEGLRAVGVRIAVDNLGVGNANYAMVLDARPDYFKIDGYFIRDCRSDFRRRVVLSSIVELARQFGGQTVAEAVEDDGDLHTVTALGVRLAQGRFLGPELRVAELGHLAPIPTTTS